MGKAVLVIDMPKSCHYCPLYIPDQFGAYCTMGNGRKANMEGCPLKSLPEVDEREHFLEWSRGYQGGWNDCIDAICR